MMGWFNTSKDSKIDCKSACENSIKEICFRIKELERAEKLSKVIKSIFLGEFPHASGFRQVFLIKDGTQNKIEIVDCNGEVIITLWETEAIDFRDFLLECYPMIKDCTGGKNEISTTR
jgi:hypothetical protein